MADDVLRSRPLGVISTGLLKGLLIALVLVGVVYISSVHLYLRIGIFPVQYYGIVLGLALSATFLVNPISITRASRCRLPWYDIVLGILGFAVGLYVSINYRNFQLTSGVVTPERWIPGIIAIILCLEATRRIIGKVVTLIALILILYTHFGYLMPGLLYVKPISWPMIGSYFYLDVNTMFGPPLAVVADQVLGFIVYGAILMTVGGGRSITDFALAAFGRFTGGPAKVAVISSAIFGMFSGSVSANVVLVGSATIPMMKSVGFKPHLAGAVEAVASTGGQIMPPVMGAAAFLMAEFLGIPYTQVAIAAIFPAVLFFLSIFIQVHLEAKKLNLKGLAKGETPSFTTAIIAIWPLLASLTALIYTLFFANWAPGKAALLASVVSFVAGYTQRKNRLKLSEILDAMAGAGRVVIDIGVMGAAAGLIVGAIQLTGSTFSLTLLATELGSRYLPLLLFIVGLIAMILGMGMTTTAIYVMLAVLVCPAISSLGIPALAAHLFVFYYALMGFITPPVCPAVFVAAPIAGAPMMKTGLTATRLGIIGYIIPFFFVFSPALLLKGPPVEVVLSVLTAMIGVSFLAIGVNRYLFKPIGWTKTVLLIMSSLLLIVPVTKGLGTVFNAIGIVLGMLLLLPECIDTMLQRRAKRQIISFKGES